MSYIRRKIAAGGLLLLILGFLAGTIFPQKYLPWSVEEAPRSPVMVQQNAVPAAPDKTDSSAKPENLKPEADRALLNPKENFPLLNTACTVVRVIQQRDYKTLSSYVDQERGLTITPYSTVDLENDLNFTPTQVRGFGDDTEHYNWGMVAGQGEMINMTPEEFFSAYLFSVDFSQASRIGLDRVNISGNALENVAEAYPDCRFVDFTYPGSGGAGQSQDWCSLKLVFSPGEYQWQLAALIHSQWTP